jgi:hypothetical protein
MKKTMKKTVTTLALALLFAIIQRQLDSKTASNYVLEALSKYELIADKPKQIKK